MKNIKKSPSFGLKKNRSIVVAIDQRFAGYNSANLMHTYLMCVNIKQALHACKMLRLADCAAGHYNSYYTINGIVAGGYSDLNYANLLQCKLVKQGFAIMQ